MRQILYFLLFTLCGSAVYAQPGVFKYDIATSVENSFPQYLTAFGDRVVFFAVESTKGWEPWVTDSAGPAKLVSNLNVASNGSSIEPGIYQKPACVADGRFYFSADNGTAGAELYSWAGGSASPGLIVDIEVGAGGCYPDNLVKAGFDIFFKAGTAAEGTELWKYNITTATATMLSKVNPGPDSFVTGNLTLLNNMVYFTGKTANEGIELYVYDRVQDTVMLIADINPGPASSEPQDLIAAAGKLYFSADDGVYGRELYAYAGSGSPQRVTDINTGVSSSIATYGVPHMLEYKNKLYFSATSGNTEFHMYSYDFSNGQTALACKTNNAGSSNPTWLTHYEDKIYFSSYDTVKGLELWSFDGTNTPVLVADICAGKGNSKPQFLTVVGTNLYFRANECGGIGDELFRYNYKSVGVQNISFSGEVKLYPNPVQHIAMLEIKLQKPKHLQIQLTDISGKMVWSGERYLNAATNTIDIPMQSLGSGAYFYRVLSAEGALYSSGKIIKQ